jgi:hypothetical protein
MERLIPDGSTVLALGVTNPSYSPSSNLVELELARRTSVTGLYYPALTDMSRRIPFSLVRGDALKLPFRDDAFDYVFSNAVIEHVGDTSHQETFVEESLRVARRGVVHTTPNRWFPVETHAKVPLLHWLPRPYHPRVLSNRRYSWQDRDRLLSRREFTALFTGRTTVHGWPALWPVTLVVTQASTAERGAPSASR